MNEREARARAAAGAVQAETFEGALELSRRKLYLAHANYLRGKRELARKNLTEAADGIAWALLNL